MRHTLASMEIVSNWDERGNWAKKETFDRKLTSVRLYKNSILARCIVVRHPFPTKETYTGVTPKVNLRIPLHADEEARKRGDPPWF